MASEALLPVLVPVLVAAAMALTIAGLQRDREGYPDRMEKEIDDLLRETNNVLYDASERLMKRTYDRIRQRKKNMREEEYETMLFENIDEVKKSIIDYWWEEESPLRMLLKQKTLVANLRLWESRFSNGFCYLGVILIIPAIVLTILLLTGTTLSYESGMFSLFAFSDMVVAGVLYLVLSCINSRRLRSVISSGVSSCRTKSEKLRKGGSR